MNGTFSCIQLPLIIILNLVKVGMIEAVIFLVFLEARQVLLFLKF